MIRRSLVLTEQVRNDRRARAIEAIVRAGRPVGLVVIQAHLLKTIELQAYMSQIAVQHCVQDGFIERKKIGSRTYYWPTIIGYWFYNEHKSIWKRIAQLSEPWQ